MPKEEAEIIMESILQPIKTFDQAVETLGEIPAIAVKKSKWALVTSFVIYVLSVPLLLPKKLHADCTKAEKLAEMLLKKGVISVQERDEILKDEENLVKIIAESEEKEEQPKEEKNIDIGGIKINGVMRARFSSVENKVNLPNAWLKFSGVWNDIGFELRPDFSSNKNEKQRLMRANITLPIALFSPYMKEISFGKIFDPSSDQFPDPFLLRTIDYSHASILPDDIGAVLRGEAGPLIYEAAVLNGNGFFEMSDDNSSKDISGRLLLDVKKLIKSDYLDELTFGAILKRGKQPEPIGMREIFGGDFSVRAGPLWMNGGINKFRDSVLETYGWWLLSTYDMPYGLQPVFQLDSLDEERNLLGGLNWLIKENTELKLNVVRHLKFSPAQERKNYELLLQIQQRF